MQGDFEYLLEDDGLKRINTQIQRRNERVGGTLEFKDSILRLDSMMKTETTAVWSDGRQNLILSKIDAIRCELVGPRQVGFYESSKTFGQWSSQWASLVNSNVHQGSVPYEIRWHRSGTTLRSVDSESRSEASIQSVTALNVGETENYSTDRLEAG